MKPSIQPIHTEFGGITYDSRFEASIARILQQFVYKNCRIDQHVKIKIKPATDIYPDRYWACNFVITYKRFHKLIEAKGFVDPSFIHKIELLEFFNNDEFQKLLVVVDRNFKIPKSMRYISNKVAPYSGLELIISEWMNKIDAIYKPP